MIKTAIWENKVITIHMTDSDNEFDNDRNALEFEGEMNNYGKNGWELAAVTQNGTKITAYLKREKKQ